MKRFMITLLCLLAAACPPLALCAQNLQMLVDGQNSSQVALEDLRVDTKIAGSIATTTWTMVFRNSSSRLLEGELTFPLPEGITVSRYAIDINGELRDAVPVEKAKGTTVLEAIEQRRVDPGLLERVEGNAFRTRIYPLPAGGTRTVLIGYEEVLSSKGTKLEYRLPLVFQREVPKVTIAIASYQGGKPEAGSATGVAFQQQGSAWTATKELSHFISNKPLVFHIPQPKEPRVIMQGKGNHYYALINTPSRYGSRERILPKDITILWDASLSGLRRNHDAELELLDGYLRRVANGTVNLIVFSNAVQPMQTFAVKNSDWHLLREALERVVYDGGTQMGKLDLRKMPGREFLLFGDGLSTYGSGELTVSWPPVYCINISVTADYASLRYIAAKTGGQVIDLSRMATYTALEQLTTQQLQLMGVQTDVDVDEVYPNVPVAAINGASVSAVIHKKKGELTLLYGYGSMIMEEKTIKFDADMDAAADVDLGRVWAEQKVAALDRNYERNKAVIESLGKRFGLVTRNTSLIVLENLNDYLSYEIEPPAELRDAYDRAMKGRSEQRALAVQNRLNSAEVAFNKLTEWWKARFDPVPPKQEPAAAPASQRPDSKRGVEVHAVRGYQAPIIDPENPGGRQIKTAEQIEKAPARNVSDIAALSTQLYQGGSGGGLNIGGGRALGTKYVIDGVQLPPGASNFTNQAPGSVETITTFSSGIPARYGEASGGIMDEVPPLFGIGEGRRQKNRRDEMEKAVAAMSKLAKLTDTFLLDSIFYMSEEEQYATYLNLRPARLHNPSFYFQVARRFMETNRKDIGLRILSNLAELDLENYEVYKMLAYKLHEVGEKDAALEAFRKVLVWRPMDPQSRRDYGLTLADAGFYLDAVDTLFAAMTVDVDPSLQNATNGIEETLLCDINGIIVQHPEAASRVPRNLIQSTPSDIRVVINWNMKSTDIDLWVTDPKGEKCYYGHNQTAIGGRMSKDITEGFGPEQFLLRNAVSGRYKVEVNYYGDRQVKIAGPTTVMAEVYTGWETPHQQRQIMALQLKPTDHGGVLIGEFDFGRMP